MYFATDSSDERNVCRALVDRIRRCSKLNWFVLVDGAFDYASECLVSATERYVLYDYGSMTDLKDASPYLIPLTPENPVLLQSELTRVVRHRKARPMLSFIGTTATACEVSKNFQKFSIASSEDNQEFLLRFADTRVLATLHSDLRREYWDGMACLFACWLIIDRKGDIHELPLNEIALPLSSKFLLSSLEFSALVSTGEPDAIIDVIADTNPEALPDCGSSILYEQIAASCAFAKEHSVHTFPDLVALAYVGILDNGAGLNDPRLRDFLMRREWKAGHLIDDLIDFVS